MDGIWETLPSTLCWVTTNKCTVHAGRQRADESHVYRSRIPFLSKTSYTKLFPIASEISLSTNYFSASKRARFLCGGSALLSCSSIEFVDEKSHHSSYTERISKLNNATMANRCCKLMEVKKLCQ